VVLCSVVVLYRPYFDVCRWGDGTDRSGLCYRMWNVWTSGQQSVGTAGEDYRFRFPVSRDVFADDNLRLDLPESVSFGGIQRRSCCQDCRKGSE